MCIRISGERKIVLAEKESNTEANESERFNSMLNAAQKQVGVKSAPQSENGGGSLTQAQIEAMLSGDDFDIDLDEDDDEDAGEESADEKTANVTPPDEEKDEDTAIADMFREGINADSQAAAEETEKKVKKKKEKKPKEKKEKKPLDKAVLAKVLIAAAVVVALALGYCVSLLFFTDAIKTSNYDFTLKAAKAVNSMLTDGREMYVYKAFVRNGISLDECMLYAVTSSEKSSDSEKAEMFRVVINHDAPNKINVYYTLDEQNPEYIKMLESGNETKVTKANMLKAYSDAIFEADKEIQIGSPSWEKIECTDINKDIAEQRSASEQQ